jgi:hypothetical protein
VRGGLNAASEPNPHKAALEHSNVSNQVLIHVSRMFYMCRVTPDLSLSHATNHSRSTVSKKAGCYGRAVTVTKCHAAVTLIDSPGLYQVRDAVPVTKMLIHNLHTFTLKIALAARAGWQRDAVTIMIL